VQSYVHLIQTVQQEVHTTGTSLCCAMLVKERNQLQRWNCCYIV